jgi:hypothetical protein
VIDDHTLRLLHPLGENHARELLAALGLLSALRAYNRACAVDYATKLLRQRVDRASIKTRIAQTYGLKRRTCYYVINDAIQQFCKRDGGDCTTEAQT